MRSSVPSEMAAHKTATAKGDRAVVVLCVGISGGTLHLTVEHLQRIPNSALCRGHIVNDRCDSSTEKMPK